MGNLRPEIEARNPLQDALTKTLADAIALAVTRPDVIEALRAAFTPKSEAAPKATGLTKPELAKALGTSTSTIDRLDRDGAPFSYCGDQKRYDLEPYRLWVAARGKRPAANAQREVQ